MTLRLDWCSYEAAKYACEHWHYSKCIPKSKLAKVGVWENGIFIGAVIFGVGANNNLGKPFGIKQTECCELVRIALREHKSSVTRIVSIALKMVARAFPNLRLVVSFADTEQGHQGTIYVAGGWVFAGQSIPADEYIVNGKRWHGRSLRNSKPSYLTTKQYAKSLDSNAVVLKGSSKLRFLMGLGQKNKSLAELHRKPYPKSQARARSTDSGAPNDQLGGGGADPTRALISEGAENNG